MVTVKYLSGKKSSDAPGTPGEPYLHSTDLEGDVAQHVQSQVPVTKIKPKLHTEQLDDLTRQWPRR